MLELFNKLIEVRDIAHQIHLNKSETQAKHEALEEFYTSLLEDMDDFIEVYQGQFGLVENFGEFKSVDSSNHIKYFEDFAVFVNSKRSEVDQENAVHLEAMIDDIIISTYKLLYKLKYIK
jgi:hypothetical protein